MFFSPGRNDPEKKNTQIKFCHPSRPGTIPEMSLCLCVFSLCEFWAVKSFREVPVKYFFAAEEGLELFGHVSDRFSDLFFRVFQTLFSRIELLGGHFGPAKNRQTPSRPPRPPPLLRDPPPGIFNERPTPPLSIAPDSPFPSPEQKKN